MGTVDPLSPPEDWWEDDAKAQAWAISLGFNSFDDLVEAVEELQEWE